MEGFFLVFFRGFLRASIARYSKNEVEVAIDDEAGGVSDQPMQIKSVDSTYNLR
jgi:hypothetical protein